MYSELLAASLATGAANEYERQPGEMLATLLAARGRLAGSSPDPFRLVHEQIAQELAYDVALVRLCQTRDIAFDQRAFAQPVVERRRLERALAAQGIDVDGLLA